MSTKIYGASDDLIEVEGDVNAEGYGGDDYDSLMACSDGTVLVIKYGKPGAAIWAITVKIQGALFDRFETGTNEDAKIYSDIVHFKDGLQWVWIGSQACKMS